jgi:hypothetical protein
MLTGERRFQVTGASMGVSSDDTGSPTEDAEWCKDPANYGVSP